MNCRTCAGPCALKGSNIPCDCEGYKPMSHYDQIKAMSVEELNDYIGQRSLCVTIQETTKGWCEMHICPECIVEWLKSEAEEGE